MIRNDNLAIFLPPPLDLLHGGERTRNSDGFVCLR